MAFRKRPNTTENKKPIIKEKTHIELFKRKGGSVGNNEKCNGGGQEAKELKPTESAMAETLW